MKLKRRSPDDPVRKEVKTLADSLRRLFVAICEALYIDRLVEWLNKKLTNKH